MGIDDTSEELTTEERSFVLRMRVMKMLWEGAFGLGAASLNMKLMRLSGGDTAAIAAANAGTPQDFPHPSPRSTPPTTTQFTGETLTN